jgi:uncharacterized membrane protein
MTSISRSLGGKSFLLLVVLFILLTGLSVVINIPVLRQLLSFLFLTFLPGLLIIYILRLDKIDLATKIVLSVGLSVTFSMFFGLAVNSSLLGLGYNEPLSTTSLLISFSLANLILAILAYIRNRNIALSFSNLGLTTGEKALLIVPSLFPLLSIVGMRIMNLGDNNVLLLALLFLIFAYVLFVSVYHHKVSERLYPSLILLISISLLLMYSLRSNHIIGADTHSEYYAFQAISSSLHWGWGVVGPEGGYHEVCLSVSLLPPIYQSFLNINPEYLFKVLYSLIVSLAPLVVYILSRKYIGSFYAFLASIFFVSQTVFLWTPSNIRSNIAVLFFALAIMVLFHDGIGGFAKRAFFIIFAASCIVSHYSTSYIFLFILLLTWVGMQILSTIVSRKKRAGLSDGQIGGGPAESSAAVAEVAVPRPPPVIERGITITMVVLFFAMVFFWYSQVTGVAFTDGVNFVKASLTNLYNLVFLGLRGPGLGEAFGRVPAYHEAVLLRIEVVFTWLTVLFIAIGVLSTIGRFRAMVSTPLSGWEKPSFLLKRFDVECLVLSAACCALLVAMVVLPYVSESYGAGRTYFQAMVPLSIFFVLGGITIARLLKSPPYWIILLVLIPFLMCTTGLMYQLGGFPRAITLNSEGSLYDTMYIHDQESYAIKFMKQNGEENTKIFSERVRLVQSQGPIPASQIESLLLASEEGKEIDGYVYLRYLNVMEGKFIARDQLRHDMPQEWSNILSGRNKLYANGGSEVYR